MSQPLPDQPATLASLARHWARTREAQRAFVFLGPENVEAEVLTYAGLDGAARALAADLSAHAMPGDRVLLMFQSGLSFVVSFFAAHYAGMIPVPVVPVRNGRLRDASLSIAADCRPAVLLAPDDQVDAAARQLRALPELARVRPLGVAFDTLRARARAQGCSADAAHPAQIGMLPPESPTAFLQYTSGSTSAPKGVCVSQANLFANLEMQRLALRNPPGAVYVGWAPLYHDMGLIANVLEPFYLGGLCVLMAPSQMAQSPWLWLQAISDYGAHTSGGSNYAYDLCVARLSRILRGGMDLSRWKVAFNSAEPVRADTVRRFCEAFAPLGFRREAMFPCYGMAEATLLVTGGGQASRPVLRTISKQGLALDRCAAPLGDGDRYDVVGCGAAVPGAGVAVVDPDSRVALPEGSVGEIWVCGPHIPLEYWNRPSASRETFHARLRGDASGQRYLRTGDLGYLNGGELYVTGRLKDMLVVRGRNLYPQDIELVAERAYPGLRPGSAAAFALQGEGGEARTGLVIEVERTQRLHFDAEAAARDVRRAVLDEFDIMLHELRFVEPGSVPKTSSGKVRRAESRERLLRDTMPVVGPPRMHGVPVAEPAVAEES
ncbi:fatty acyl-AMP ligase [Bordetella genomosp. 13]|uniref:fatty acyl-AMP ligase n=1 Tax=Bordetella genomosp. 13 TaxID=463040 RepID=UPI0011A6ECF8|nr:fatty acyl-AMP ligase [Bordetella genomosp. 13]